MDQLYASFLAVVESHILGSNGLKYAFFAIELAKIERELYYILGM